MTAVQPSSELGGRFRVKPGRPVDAIRLLAYTEALPGFDGNAGDVWRWLMDRNATFQMLQVDPGPAFLHIYKDHGPGALVPIGSWIVHTQLGFESYTDETFRSIFEQVPE